MKLITLTYLSCAQSLFLLHKRDGLFDNVVGNLIKLSDDGSGTAIATQAGKIVGLEAKTNIAQYEDEGEIFPKEKVKDSSESVVTKLVKDVGLFPFGK